LASKTGIVRGREIKKNRDGTTSRLMLQVEMSSPDDIQTVEYVPIPGQDENPINGTKVFVFTIGSSYKIAIGADDGIVPAMNTGEKRIYSLDDAGAIQAFIKLLKTGEIDIEGSSAFIKLLASGIIEVNGNSDFAVRFDALNTILQGLVAAINTALAGKLDGSGTPGTITLDLSGAKVDEVKLP